MESVVFAFGRLNPPTIGHASMVDQIRKLADANKGDAHLYLSNKQAIPTDPLTFQEKVKYVGLAFGLKVKVHPYPLVKNAFDAVEWYMKQKYRHIIYVHGSDSEQVRLAKNLTTYMSKPENKKTLFETYELLRTNGAGVAGMSATKARQMVMDNKLEDFCRSVPLKLREGKDLFILLHKHLVLEKK